MIPITTCRVIVLPITQSEEIAVDVTSIFRLKGYLTVTVCSDKNLLLDNKYYTYPSFFYSNNFNEVEKIEQLKNWFIQIDRVESPEVIIVAVPDAMMVLDQIIHFGYPYMSDYMSY